MPSLRRYHVKVRCYLPHYNPSFQARNAVNAEATAHRTLSTGGQLAVVDHTAAYHTVKRRPCVRYRRVP